MPRKRRMKGQKKYDVIWHIGNGEYVAVPGGLHLSLRKANSMVKKLLKQGVIAKVRESEVGRRESE